MKQRLALMLALVLVVSGCSWSGAGTSQDSNTDETSVVVRSAKKGAAAKSSEAGNGASDEEGAADEEGASKEAEGDSQSGDTVDEGEGQLGTAADGGSSSSAVSQGGVSPLPAQLDGGTSTLQVDLNGDGRSETVRGIFNQWTSTAFIEVLDGGDVAVRATFPGTRQVIPTQAQSGRTVFLLWQRDGYGNKTVQVTQFRYLNDHWVNVTPSFEGMSSNQGAPATDASVSSDGTIQVEWAVGDPMNHVQIQEYEISFVHGVYPWSKTRIRHQVTYPSTAEGVLQSALVNVLQPHGDQELASFFASTAAMNAFQAAVPAGAALENTSVSTAGSCSVSTQSAGLDADMRTPFVIQSGSGSITGTATFTTDASGRLVIQGVEVGGRCW